MNRILQILFGLLFFWANSISYGQIITLDGINYDISGYTGNASCQGPANKASFVVENLTIPAKVNGCSVVRIDENAFKNCTGVTGELTLPQSLSSIDASAFEGCTGISKLNLPLSLEYIYENAFRNCTGLIGELLIPDGVKIIYASAFRNCRSLSSVVLGRSIGNIGYCGHSSGMSYHIHGGYAFSGCSNLQYIKSLRGTPPNTDTETGPNFDDYNIPLYVDEDFVKDYKGATSYAVEWSRFTNIQAIRPPAEQIVLSANNLMIKEKEISIITYTVKPENADLTNIIWDSQNPEIAKVQNGIVTGVKAGQTVITLSIGQISASCIVTVVSDSQTEGGSCNWYEDGDENATIRKRVHMIPDDDVDLSARLNGLSASSWTSGNEDIVEVTRRGIAYAYEFGETVVRAKDSEGKTVAVFEVFVCPTVTVVHGDGVIYNHHVLYNSQPTLTLTAPNGYKLGGVTHDKKDVTELVGEDGKYVPAEPIKENTVINLALEETGNGPTTGADAVLNDPNIRISVNGHTVNITGVPANTVVRMYNLAGTMLFEHVNYPDIQVIDSGVYLIEIDGQPNKYKILVK